MRLARLAVLLLQGCQCLLPVDENPLDAGRDAGAMTRTDAGLDAGPPDGGGPWLPVQCPGLADGGLDWCVDFPGNVRRCADAELVGCSSLTKVVALSDGWIAWLAFHYAAGRGEVWARRVDSLPRLVASGGEIDFLVLRDGFAYWTDRLPGTISRAPLAGGNVETIVSGRPSVTWLAVDGAFVYWVDSPTGIWRAPVTGGAPREFLSNENFPSALEAFGAHLYWSGPSLQRVPLAGGPVQVLFPGGGGGQLEFAGGFVYWSGGQISRGPLDGSGSAQVVAPAQDNALGIAVDQTRLFWMNHGQNFGQPTPRLYTAQPDGAGAALFLTPLAGGPIALDATHLYFGSVQHVYRFAR